MEFHNPWREPLENCMAGDNYLKTQEYADLIEELDDLYRYRCGQHSSLNDAYANGRDDEREEREAAIAEAVAAERERCARICDVTPPYPFRASIEAAHAIRNQKA